MLASFNLNICLRLLCPMNPQIGFLGYEEDALQQ